MKTALLVNSENFEKYANWSSAGFELIHIGTQEPDPEKIIATGAGALLVDPMLKVGAEIILNMPELRIIHSFGVAYNGIDLEAARDVGVYVCNNAGVNAYPVAEQALLLILSLLKKYRWGEDMVYAGRQMEAKSACFENGLPELGGLSVGLVGLGAISKALASMLTPFGCKLSYFTRSGDHGLTGLAYIPLDELYSSCDIISLGVPVTPETTNMINSETLKLFKRGAILINTARGDLMDLEAVIGALKSGQLGGLGADTLAPGPLSPDDPLLRELASNELQRRVALSPHIGGITAGCFIRAYERSRQNIEAVANGQRPNCIVNGL